MATVGFLCQQSSSMLECNIQRKRGRIWIEYAVADSDVFFQNLDDFADDEGTYEMGEVLSVETIPEPFNSKSNQSLENPDNPVR